MAVIIENEMSNDAVPVSSGESLELSVAELLQRARPLPPLEEMRIDDLSDDEAEAFLAAVPATPPTSGVRDRADRQFSARRAVLRLR